VRTTKGRAETIAGSSVAMTTATKTETGRETETETGIAIIEEEEVETTAETATGVGAEDTKRALGVTRREAMGRTEAEGGEVAVMAKRTSAMEEGRSGSREASSRSFRENTRS
jgi:hypothetical protein